MDKNRCIINIPKIDLFKTIRYSISTRNVVRFAWDEGSNWSISKNNILIKLIVSKWNLRQTTKSAHLIQKIIHNYLQIEDDVLCNFTDSVSTLLVLIIKTTLTILYYHARGMIVKYSQFIFECSCEHTGIRPKIVNLAEISIPQDCTWKLLCVSSLILTL